VLYPSIISSSVFFVDVVLKTFFPFYEIFRKYLVNII
jgi:hypothetical protein